MKHDLEINTRMLINKWTKFVSFLLVRLKKAEGDRRSQEGARSRSHSTKTKTETESRRSGTVTWRAASEDAVSCEGRGDRSWRRNARTRHTWRVSRQYAFDSDELIRRFWRIAIRILATDTGTVFHLERKKKCYNAYTRCFVTFTGDTRESVTFPFLEYDSKAISSSKSKFENFEIYKTGNRGIDILNNAAKLGINELVEKFKMLV